MSGENILLISKDILRCDYLSCYGSNKWNTKNIDELAEKGTIFRNYYTVAPSTAMAFTGMFSGLNPFELNRKRYTEVEPFDQCPTLFERFEEKGYESHIIWDENWMNKAYIFSKVYGGNTTFHNLKISQRVGPHYSKSQKIKPKKESRPLEKIVGEVDKIFNKKKSNIFLWIHLPHVLNGRTGYGSDIDLFDKLVGTLRNFFYDDEIYLTADHGHMDLSKGIPAYGFHVYEPIANIPFITPNFLGKGEVSQVISNIQLKNIIINNKLEKQEFVYSDSQYYLQENRKLMIRKDDYKYSICLAQQKTRLKNLERLR